MKAKAEAADAGGWGACKFSSGCFFLNHIRGGHPLLGIRGGGIESSVRLSQIQACKGKLTESSQTANPWPIPEGKRFIRNSRAAGLPSSRDHLTVVIRDSVPSSPENRDRPELGSQV